jgi:hypothetical protein
VTPLRAGPAWRLSSEAQPLLRAHGVHLDDDAVDLVAQRVTHLLRLGDEREHLINVARYAMIGIDLEPQQRQGLQGIRMFFRIVLALHQKEIGIKIQAALGHDVRLEHADGPGGGVARVGELG